MQDPATKYPGRLRPPPELLLLDKGIRVLLCVCLEHYARVAAKAHRRSQEIPKAERPWWYENNVTYWKHLERGLRWVRKMVLAIGDPRGVEHKHSTEATDTFLPIGGNESVNEHRTRLREWFEPL